VLPVNDLPELSFPLTSAEVLEDGNLTIRGVVLEDVDHTTKDL